MEPTESPRKQGIAFRLNTMRAHRLIYRVQSIGHRPEDVETLVERLFIAHFKRGEDIGSIATLAEIAADCGDRKDHVIEYLESDEGTAQVRSLVNKLGDLGVSGVPFIIIQRRLALTGAQSSDVLAAAIMQTM